MSVCAPCQQVNTLSACLTSILVGKISSENTAVYVYLKNLTTDAAPIRFTDTSDVDGYVEIDVSDFEPIEGHDYEIWVTLASAKNANCKEDIYPADCDSAYVTTTYPCFTVQFEYIDDDALERVYGSEETLVIND